MGSFQHIFRPSDICLIPRLHSPYSRDKDTSKFWGKPNAKEILYLSPVKKHLLERVTKTLQTYRAHLCNTIFQKRGRRVEAFVQWAPFPLVQPQFLKQKQKNRTWFSAVLWKSLSYGGVRKGFHMLHKCDLTVRGRLCRVCGNKSPHTSAFPRKARLFFFLFPPPNTRTKLKRLLYRFVENQAKKDTSHCRKLSVPNDGKADLRKTGNLFLSSSTENTLHKCALKWIEP